MEMSELEGMGAQADEMGQDDLYGYLALFISFTWLFSSYIFGKSGTIRLSELCTSPSKPLSQEWVV